MKRILMLGIFLILLGGCRIFGGGDSYATSLEQWIGRSEVTVRMIMRYIMEEWAKNIGGIIYLVRRLHSNRRYITAKHHLRLKTEQS